MARLNDQTFASLVEDINEFRIFALRQQCEDQKGELIDFPAELLKKINDLDPLDTLRLNNKLNPPRPVLPPATATLQLPKPIEIPISTGKDRLPLRTRAFALVTIGIVSIAFMALVGEVIATRVHNVYESAELRSAR